MYSANKGGDNMNKKKSKLRRKLFVLILVSMLFILTCMIAVFAFFTSHLRTQEKTRLLSFQRICRTITLKIR